MKKVSYNLPMRIIAMALSLVLIVSLLPSVALFSVTAAGADVSGILSSTMETDPSTLDSWKTAFDPVNISTEHAGGIWTDKTVLKPGDISTAFPNVSGLNVGANNFLVALSALAANSVVVGKGSTATDTMFVLDISGSMSASELRAMVNATNEAIHKLLDGAANTNRVGVVLYSDKAHVLMPLDHYTPVTDGGVVEYIELTDNYIRTARAQTGVEGGGNGSDSRPDWWPEDWYWNEGWDQGPGQGQNPQTETVYLKNSANENVNNSVRLTGGTYIQGGLWAAWEAFEAVSVSGSRTPIVVLMSDGAPTYTTNNFNNVPDDPSHGAGSSSTAGDGLVTQLTAAYVKEKLAARYNSPAYFYTLGLGVDNVTNSNIAKAVLNPSGSPQQDITNLWARYNSLSSGNTMSVTLGGRNSTVNVAFDATVKDKGAYVDRYFDAAQASDLATAFQGVVNEISLKSGYVVTRLNGQNANMGGYVSFVDEIGTGMQIKDVKGILIDGENSAKRLYSGQILAHALHTNAFGTAENPTTLGDNMVWALGGRLDIDDPAQVRELLGKAYAAGQLSYNETTGEYSNYIGWYGDANGNFVGFWDETSTDPIPAGAAFANKCYLLLGSTTSEQTNHASDMMYITIQVSKAVTAGANGELQVLDKTPEKVTFSIPASLLPTVTYEIELNADSVEEATSATVTYSAAAPIRLLYEVGVHSELTPLNIKEFIREGYKAIDSETGNYYLYTNAWNWEGADDPGVDWQDPESHPSKDNQIGQTVLPDTGKNAITYAYFEPSEDNEHYYFTEDMQIYVKSGNNYTPITQVPTSAEGATYYFQHITYTNEGTGIDRHYGQLSEKAVQAAIDANSVKVPAGTMHYYTVTHQHDRDKTNNATGSYFAVRHHLVDAAINSSNLQEHSYELVYMGNNGRITYAPAQGIQLSKTMNDNSLPQDTFTFDVALTAPAGTTLAGAYQTLHVDVMGNETVGNAAVSGNKLTVSLKPGESIYILDLPTGTTYQVTERKATGYLESASVGTTGVVANNTVKTVSFVNKVRGTGSLRVVKTVTYFNGAVKNDASANNKFPVTVTLTDGLDAYVGKVTVDGQEKDVTNGQITFDIVDGQTVLITNIPDGVTYTVVEGTVPKGYTFNANASVGLTGTVTTGGAAALLSNTYTPDSVKINETKPSIIVDVSKTLETQQQNVDFTFEFKLQQLDTVANEWVDVTIGGQKLTTQINMTAAGTKDAIISLAGLTFDKAGVYDFRVVETKGSIAGMTYDRTFHDFEIVVTDTDLDGQLEISAVNTVQHAVVDWDANNEVAKVTTDFTNTYEVGSTKLTIQANKILKDLTVVASSPAKDKALKDGQFTFLLYKTDSSFATTGITPVEVKNGVRGDVIFPTQTYTQADTYYYVIKEVNDAKPGYTYDNAVYQVTVTVEPVEGQLQVTKVLVQKNEEAAVNVTANVSDNILSADTIVFENTYKAEPVSVTLGGNKTLNGWNITDNMFTFVLKNAAGEEIASVENVGGSYTFPQIDYIVEGTSTYTISEVRDGKNGYTYDETEYRVTVEVIDNGAGQLVAKVTYTENGVPVASPDFVNSYKAEGTAPVVLGGFKELLVDANLFTRVLKDGDFSFVLKDENGNEVEIVKNVGDAFTFTGLTFDKAGIYKYTISEVVGSRGGVTYDQTIYNVTVTVTDSGSGKLTAEVSYEAGNASVDPEDVIFKNRYAAAEAKLVLAGKKVIVGRELQADEFEFVLWDSEGKELDRKTNDADGNITFDELKYQGVGVYTYTISEIKDGKSGVIYDETEFAVTVTVQDNGEGQLVTVVDIPNKGDVEADFQFFNRYQVNSVTVDIAGDKVLEDLSSLIDKTLNDFEFQFVLTDAEGNVIETVSDNGNGFNFTDLKYDEVGEHVYYITEVKNGIAGMTYDNSKYRVTVKVTDNGAGQLEAKVTYEKAQNAESNIYESVTAISFHNVYKAAPTSVTFGGNKILNGWNIEDGMFTFVLKNAVGDEITRVENVGNRYTFPQIDYTEEGAYTYIISEVRGDKNGYIYDDTVYHVTVVITDNGAGQLETRVNYIKGGVPVASPDFVNRYQANTVTVGIAGDKVLEDLSSLTDKTLNDFEFQFVLTDAEGNVIETVSDNGKGFNFTDLIYDEVGEHVYYITEVKNGIAGMTYDNSKYRVTVKVTDNGAGQLEAEVTYEKAENAESNIYESVTAISFHNVYKAAPTSATFGGDKTLDGWDIEDDMFTFILKNAMDEEIASVKNVGGSYIFPEIEYVVEGTFTYTISEIRGDKNGYIYDDTVYHVTVVVTDNGAGQLEAKVTYTKNGVPAASPDFVNGYQAEGTAPVVLGGFKQLLVDNKLLVRVLKDGEFSFVLKDEDGNEVEIVKNVGDTFTFTGLTFDKAGIYKYTISEIKGNKGGVTYDETEYAVTITVSDQGSGKLTAKTAYAKENVSVDPEDVIFTNRYQANSVTVDIAGDKVLEDQSSLTDKTLNDFEFQFVLTDAEGNVIETVSDNGKGFNFTDLKYDRVGKHVYYLTEVENGIAGMTYDYSKYRITVKVTDNGAGQLEAEVTYEKAENAESDTYESVTAVNFHNIYKAKATSISFSGVKVLNGGLNLKPGDFTFILKDENGMELQAVKNGEGGRFAFQSIEYTAEGTYVYTLEEKNDGKDLITYDTAKYTLTVTVVDENGELKATTVVTKGDETVTDYGFTNIYTPEDVETIISIQKVLDNKSEETMGMNGFIFQLQEAEAQEAFTATSDDEGKAEFKLRFSAADVGKTYIYKLSEKAGDVEGMTYDDTVYEIKVVVSQNAETGELVLAVTRNDEAINGSAEFTNVYAPVSEPEEDPEEPGEDPEEDPEEPPKTADDFNMILWSTLCLGAAVMLAVLVIGKKQFVK